MKDKKLFTKVSIYALSLLLLFGLHSMSHGEEEKQDYSDIHFSTHIDRKIFLSKCGKKASESNGEEKKEYLRTYFRALPRDFETFFKTIHSNCHGNILYETSTYGYGYSRNPWGKFHPITKFVKTKEEIPKEKLSKQSQEYLASLNFQGDYEYIDVYFPNIYDELTKVIPKDIYCEKIISLCMGGSWAADDINFLQQQLSINYDSEEGALTLNKLDKRTDDEIAGFLFFYYDEPIHPASRILSKNEQYQRTKRTHPRIAQLIDKVYGVLIAEWEGELQTC